MVQRRDRVEVVAIDPSAAFAKAIREMLSRTAVSVDVFHLVMKANGMVTAVWQSGWLSRVISRTHNSHRPASESDPILLMDGGSLRSR
ncbi:transposase [Rhodococcus qingshengii]|uniref:transposase n=1 Tax=Rhodococcus qingshengii TaxID=334542 RepID=UPI003669F19D